MKKYNTYIITILLIMLIFLIGRYLFKGNNHDYYKNYNRVISEPDSIKTIGDDL